MLDAHGKVIYVGKAKNLKRRVSSYFQKNHDSAKTAALVAKICDFEVTITHSEKEALLLENQLIKSIKPKYNIFLRDDKSYPYILMTTSETFPRLAYYRGPRKRSEQYFGPYTNAAAVRNTLIDIQKVFLLRTCENAFFKNRTRPCLQHQIKRCSAPCTGLISADEYRNDVEQAKAFLRGKSTDVISALTERMEKASEELKFELAALMRDRISRLRTILEKQYVFGHPMHSIDVFAFDAELDMVAVQILFVREGQLKQTRQVILKKTLDESLSEVTEAFIKQFYLQDTIHGIPSEIIINHDFLDKELFSEILSQQAGKKIKWLLQPRREKRKWLKLAEQNARLLINNKLSEDSALQTKLAHLQKALKLKALPNHMECFDISHTQGQATIASCVVFKDGKAEKSLYRRFNITDGNSDDYAAIQFAVHKRYKPIKIKEKAVPDLIIIDGGKGQLSAAKQALDELQLEASSLISIAKGPERKAGLEKLFIDGQPNAISLDSHSSALHLLQEIRDEAHRFAIMGHRKKRSTESTTSTLENIEGIGAKKRKALLQHFGGLQGIQDATLESLKDVPGVSKELAQRIYEYFHE